MMVAHTERTQTMANSRKPKTTRRPYTRKTIRPTDKWIVGMVETMVGSNNIRMFTFPHVHTDYAMAVHAAEQAYERHGKPFVVFAKKCVIGPSRPPVLKTEFSA